MITQRPVPIVILSLAFAAMRTAPAPAQSKPWLLFLDSQSASRCDLVNADNGQLVVLQSTGQLVLVTGTDVTLQDTAVDENGFVTFEGDPAGVIDFADDGDGLRTLWWTSLTGTVVSVDGFTGQPSPTDKVPADFHDVPCDACGLWDNPSVCPVEPPTTIHLCGRDVPVVVAATMAGLMGLRFVRRRGFA